MPSACLRSLQYLPKIVTCDHGHGWKMWEATADAMGVHRSVDMAASTASATKAGEAVEAADVPVVPTATVGGAVSYTHLRAHETPEHLVCRLLLEKKKKNQVKYTNTPI
eukprot:TRINITY_DN47188_c0_g1_i1.p1 TRINITY_DN47188_c0_g1~~TRINITY_DN47188_c0_g1_i1.p1  ORF type:complete len:109 (-),score=19.56 TRINITY_DN47188_c0_g1_i1:79-405(-)